MAKFGYEDRFLEGIVPMRVFFWMIRRILEKGLNELCHDQGGLCEVLGFMRKLCPLIQRKFIGAVVQYDFDDRQ